MKEYQKPELDFVCLFVQETIASGEDLGDADLGLGSSEFD